MSQAQEQNTLTYNKLTDQRLKKINDAIFEMGWPIDIALNWQDIKIGDYRKRSTGLMIHENRVKRDQHYNANKWGKEYKKRGPKKC